MAYMQGKEMQGNSDDDVGAESETNSVAPAVAHTLIHVITGTAAACQLLNLMHQLICLLPTSAALSPAEAVVVERLAQRSSLLQLSQVQSRQLDQAS